MNRACDYIHENRNASKGDRKKTLAKSTVENNYVGKAKTIIRAGCHSAHIPYLLSAAQIITPKRARPSKARHAPGRAVYQDILTARVTLGVLADALLPVMGLLTGRRIGLLTYMRRENILRYNGVWIYVPESHELVDEEEVFVPVKTSEPFGFSFFPSSSRSADSSPGQSSAMDLCSST